MGPVLVPQPLQQLLPDWLAVIAALREKENQVKPEPAAVQKLVLQSQAKGILQLLLRLYRQDRNGQVARDAEGPQGALFLGTGPHRGPVGKLEPPQELKCMQSYFTCQIELADQPVHPAAAALLGATQQTGRALHGMVSVIGGGQRHPEVSLGPAGKRQRKAGQQTRVQHSPLRLLGRASQRAF